MTTTISSQPISKDTVVTITSTQLKTANLIFAEHQMLKNKVPLLESKITNLEIINSNWERVDSLRSKQILLYQNEIKNKDLIIKNMDKQSKFQKWLTGGSILASVILAITCIIK